MTIPQNKKRAVLIIGFALFSMFFGAGNLSLPPLLGLQSGSAWGTVTIGFIISAVVLPILAIYAHAKIQGTMYDFGKRVSPVFSILFCVIIYVISIVIPSPRTASFAHEMAIKPYFETSSLLTSILYFSLVFIVAIKRKKILNIIGKFLTPMIVIILCVIICIGIFSPHETMLLYSEEQPPILKGLLEGYQTFDAIGGVVIGGVLIISLNLNGYSNHIERKRILLRSGILAGLGLTIIYAGLIFLGALSSNEFTEAITRSELLTSLSLGTLGTIGTYFLSVLVALACFTTAVGITTGTADYFSELIKHKHSYNAVVFISCLIGILVGQLDFHTIIVIAIPILMIAYPVTIVLILLNVLPNKWVSDRMFKCVVIVAILFSIPDMLTHISCTKETVVNLIEIIPLANQGFGWFIPALITFSIVRLFDRIN